MDFNVLTGFDPLLAAHSHYETAHSADSSILDRVETYRDREDSLQLGSYHESRIDPASGVQQQRTDRTDGVLQMSRTSSDDGNFETLDCEMDFDYEITRVDGPKASTASEHMTSNSLYETSGLGAVARQRTTCPVCSMPMLRRTLRRHMRAKHPDKLPHMQRHAHPCSQCSRSFERKDNLNRHMAEQHGSGPGSVQCSGCKAQTRRRGLDSHLRSQACKQAEFQADMAWMAEHRQAWWVSMSSENSGRFDCSNVVDPLLATMTATVFGDRYIERVVNFDHYYFTKFLQLHGIAMRAMFRVLQNPSYEEARLLIVALPLFLVNTWITGHQKNEKAIVPRTLCSLEQRLGSSLEIPPTEYHFSVGGKLVAMLIHLLPSLERVTLVATSYARAMMDDKWGVNRDERSSSYSKMKPATIDVAERKWDTDLHELRMRGPARIKRGLYGGFWKVL